jgi:predicted ABC-type ATPase
VVKLQTFLTMNENPTLYVIGGANGVGKTTSFYDQFPIDCPFINADEISKKLKENMADDRNIQEIANREAIHQMNLYLSKRESFGFESNLVDIETWKFIEKIKIIGYQIQVVYYGTDDVNICIQRVKQRVKEGGHDVREDIIRQRYTQSLMLLKHFLYIPNTLILKDNSYFSKECIVFEEGVIINQIKDLPKWVENCIYPLPNQEHQSIENESIDDIRDRYKNLKLKN